MRCLVVDDDAMARAVLEHFIAQHASLELAGSCENAVDAVNLLQQQAVDVMFLDVEMPSMTGLELVQSLTHTPQVILVTAKQEYALEAFEIEVTDYLLKPVSYPRFLKAIQRVERQLHLERQQAERPDDPTAPARFVFIRSEGKLIRLNLEMIQWIEAQGDYVLIHATSKRYLVHATMKGLLDKLPAADFARVHRSYIVRIDQINDIADTTLVIDRKVIPLGSAYKEELLQRLRMI